MDRRTSSLGVPDQEALEIENLELEILQLEIEILQLEQAAEEEKQAANPEQKSSVASDQNAGEIQSLERGDADAAEEEQAASMGSRSRLKLKLDAEPIEDPESEPDDKAEEEQAASAVPRSRLTLKLDAGPIEDPESESDDRAEVDSTPSIRRGPRLTLNLNAEERKPLIISSENESEADSIRETDDEETSVSASSDPSSTFRSPVSEVEADSERKTASSPGAAGFSFSYDYLNVPSLQEYEAYIQAMKEAKEAEIERRVKNNDWYPLLLVKELPQKFIGVRGEEIYIQLNSRADGLEYAVRTRESKEVRVESLNASELGAEAFQELKQVWLKLEEMRREASGNFPEAEARIMAGLSPQTKGAILAALVAREEIPDAVTQQEKLTEAAIKFIETQRANQELLATFLLSLDPPVVSPDNLKDVTLPEAIRESEAFKQFNRYFVELIKNCMDGAEPPKPEVEDSTASGPEMDTKAAVEFKATADSGSRKPLLVHFSLKENENSSLELSIQDNGRGFPKKLIPEKGQALNYHTLTVQPYALCLLTRETRLTQRECARSDLSSPCLIKINGDPPSFQIYDSTRGLKDIKLNAEIKLDFTQKLVTIDARGETSAVHQAIVNHISFDRPKRGSAKTTGAGALGGASLCLKGIAHQLQKVGGVVLIENPPEGGAKVTLISPLPPKAAARLEKESMTTPTSSTMYRQKGGAQQGAEVAASASRVLSPGKRK